MTATSGPVRDPAWPLSRSALGLWTVHGAIRSLVAVPLALAAVFAIPDDAPGLDSPGRRPAVPGQAFACAGQGGMQNFGAAAYATNVSQVPSFNTSLTKVRANHTYITKQLRGQMVFLWLFVAIAGLARVWNALNWRD